MQTFKRIHEKEKKFKVDPRFKAVLTDDRFRAIDGESADPSHIGGPSDYAIHIRENAVVFLWHTSSGHALV
jgi:hypothetical protein